MARRLPIANTERARRDTEPSGRVARRLVARLVAMQLLVACHDRPAGNRVKIVRAPLDGGVRHVVYICP